MNMKTPTTKRAYFRLPAVRLATLTIALAITAVLLSCEGDPDNEPHESAITAFGKTAKVTGDAAISTADFNTAVGELRTILTTMTNDNNLGANRKEELAKMMDRGIIIVFGDATPSGIGGVLRVGAGHLINNKSEVYGEIVVLAMSGIFADLTPHYTNPATNQKGVNA
jgi:hypothetical protein